MQINERPITHTSSPATVFEVPRKKGGNLAARVYESQNAGRQVTATGGNIGGESPLPVAHHNERWDLEQQ